jgi:hypothetical protein
MSQVTLKGRRVAVQWIGYAFSVFFFVHGYVITAAVLLAAAFLGGVSRALVTHIKTKP